MDTQTQTYTRIREGSFLVNHFNHLDEGQLVFGSSSKLEIIIYQPLA